MELLPTPISITRFRRQMLMKRKIRRAFTKQIFVTRVYNSIDECPPQYRNLYLQRREVYRVIVRDATRDTYPERIFTGDARSTWWLIFFEEIQHHGLSFFISTHTVHLNRSGRWKLLGPGDKDILRDGWQRISAKKYGFISYDDIIEFEDERDGCYPYPHFYCQFSYDGDPFKEKWYVSESHGRLEEQKRIRN